MHKTTVAVFTFIFAFTLAGCGEIDIEKIIDQDKQEETANGKESSDGNNEGESDDGDSDDGDSNDGDSDDGDSDDGDSDGKNTDDQSNNDPADGSDADTSKDGTGTDTDDGSGKTDAEGKDISGTAIDSDNNIVFTNDGHLLIADSLYLSLTEFRNVHSSYYASDPTDAAEMAAAYVEDGLTDWRIPTEEEARFLKSYLDDETAFYGKTTLPKLNQFLMQKDFDALSIVDRYLCEDATKAFSFLINSNITKAGSKTTYHMRLVKGKEKKKE